MTTRREQIDSLGHYDNDSFGAAVVYFQLTLYLFTTDFVFFFDIHGTN